MAIAIPFEPSLTYYRLITVISGVPYIFDVRWNDRDQAWYFDVLEEDETPIVHGVKVILGMYLARRCDHTLFRDGVFLARDTTDAGIEAGIDDLGARVQVIRYSLLEVADGRGLLR